MCIYNFAEFLRKPFVVYFSDSASDIIIYIINVFGSFSYTVVYRKYHKKKKEEKRNAIIILRVLKNVCLYTDRYNNILYYTYIIVGFRMHRVMKYDTHNDIKKREKIPIK